MRYLLQIGIDKAFRFNRNVHYFELRGVRFKFVQQPPRVPPKWSDALLTILDDDYQSEVGRRALTVAGQWASALAWETQFPVAIRLLGAASWRAGLQLRQAQCNVLSWPVLPFRGDMRGVRLERIAKTTTDEQRAALTVFREAQVANSVLTQILLYWQVLEIGNRQPVGWINKAMRRVRELARVRELTARVPTGTRPLGEYLLDDCRNAIAHLKRKPGKRRIKFDDLEEHRRLGKSASILEELARLYVGKNLGVSESLWLVRRRGRGFPVYVDDDALQNGPYTLVRQ